MTINDTLRFPTDDNGGTIGLILRQIRNALYYETGVPIYSEIGDIIPPMIIVRVISGETIGNGTHTPRNSRLEIGIGYALEIDGMADMKIEDDVYSALNKLLMIINDRGYRDRWGYAGIYIGADLPTVYEITFPDEGSSRIAIITAMINIEYDFNIRTVTYDIDSSSIFSSIPNGDTFHLESFGVTIEDEDGNIRFTKGTGSSLTVPALNNMVVIT